MLSKIKSHLLNLLKFLRLADDDGMDLTNLTLYVILAGMILMRLPAGVDIATLLLALLARAHKKHLASKTSAKTAAQLEEMNVELAKVKATAVKSSRELEEFKTRLGLESLGNPFGR